METSEVLIGRSVRKVGDIADRNSSTFNIYSGEHRFYLSQLPNLSSQDHIQAFCERDATNRFKDIIAIERWLRKDPKEIYYLTDPELSGQVQGLIWHTNRTKTIDETDYPFSFAIRLYEGAQGRGLAKPFMTSVLRDLCTMHPSAAQGIWLDADVNNQDAVGLYESFGYREVGSDNGRVDMVLSPERIEEIRSS